MDVDEVFGVIGEFGRHQAQIFWSMAWLNVLSSFQMVHMVFTGAVPSELDCVIGGKATPGCPEDPSAICDSYSYNRTNFTSIATEWDLVCSLEYKSSFVQSIFMFGVLIGALSFGSLSDNFGRRPSTILSYLALTLCSIAGAFVTSYNQYAAARLLAGIFAGGVGLVTFVLQTECVGGSKRALLGAVNPACFAIGVMVYAGLAYLVRDWRHLTLACSLPGLLYVILLNRVLVESPRWCLSRGDTGRAIRILEEMATRNGTNAPKNLELKTPPAGTKRSPGVVDMCGHAAVRLRLGIMLYCWFVNSAVYYGLTMSAGDLGSNRYISVCLSGLVEIPACVAVYFLMDRLGRRPTLCLSMIIGGVSCLSILVTDPGSSGLITALALMGKLSISLSFSTIYMYAAELFPTIIRNKAMGFTSMAARVGGILSPMIVSLASYHPNSQFLVFGSLSLSAGLLAWKLPETAGQPLPEDLSDLDRELKRNSSQKELKVMPLSEDKIKLLEEDITEKHQRLVDDADIDL